MGGIGFFQELKVRN